MNGGLCVASSSIDGLSYKIVYFSGTGGTKRAALSISKSLKLSGFESDVYEIPIKESMSFNNDYLILLFPVHAFTSPEIVEAWIKSIKKVKNSRAAVISVSGGGEIFPNLACRLSSINKLKAKGFNVTYEDSIVMPSNFSVKTPDHMAVKLLELLPKKTARIVYNIMHNIEPLVNIRFIDRTVSKIGDLEKVGAKLWGKRLKASDKCNKCGICSSNCPSKNIKLTTKGPEFNSSCQFCMKCVYNCPNKAIIGVLHDKLVIKEGFNISKLEDKMGNPILHSMFEHDSDPLWNGVIKYIEEVSS